MIWRDTIRRQCVGRLWRLLSVFLLPPLALIIAACGSQQAVSEESAAHAGTNLSRQIDCMALNLYWEARGESRQGMLGVGWTVLNRVKHPEFPGSVCAVIYQGGETPPCQFSWWCDGRSDQPTNQDSWRTSRLVATELLTQPPKDPTNGAIFYHNTSIRAPWKKRREKTARIGAHVFYR